MSAWRFASRSTSTLATAAATRAFTFYVYVDSSDRYHVVKCEPEVHDVQSLVDALNTSNDFSAFVRNMRKRFQQLV